MKKIVCLQNVYFEGRFLSAGTDAALPDDVACNWVERGLAKFVGEETPVNPPAQDNKADAATSDGAENLLHAGNGALSELPTSADISQDVPPELTPEGNGVVEFENDETPEVKPDEIAETPVSPNEEKGVLRYDFTTPIPATATEDTPVLEDDTPKRGRPPKKKNGGKRR